MAGRERSIGHRNQRKSAKEKVGLPNGNCDAGHSYVCRRRHARRSTRRIPIRDNTTEDPSTKIKMNRTDDGFEDPNDDNDHVGTVSSVKGLVATLRQKEVLISRIEKKYVRIQKRNREVKEECQRLNGLLERRDCAYRRACSRYDKSLELLGEVEETRTELTARNERLEMERLRWNEDAALLKAVVYRLNSELERYQEKIAVEEDRGQDREEVEEAFARAWGRVDFHALAPLLNAYEMNFTEKKSLIARYEREITRTAGQCKKIIVENERMHAEVEELRSKCDRYAEETRALNESVLALRKRNDSCTREVEDRKRELREIYWSCERKVKSMVDENESLRRERLANVAELEKYRERHSVLSEEVARINDSRERTIPMEVHNVAIDECKRLFEELKRRYEGEKGRLSARIKCIEEEQCEKDDRLTSVTAERNHFEALTKILRRNFKRSQRRLDYVARIAYSGRISRESMKDQLRKSIAYRRQLFAEYETIVAEREKLVGILRETERENADFDRIGKSVARRVDDLKNDLIIVQSGATRQMATIEKRIKIQECRVHSVKRKYRGKVRRLRKVIKQKEDTIGSLRRGERASRDNGGTAERLTDEDK